MSDARNDAPTDAPTDAIALLKADHRKVEALFDQFESARAVTRRRTLAEQICTELKIHTAIEEEIFYPACKDRIAADTLNEALVEHDGAKLLVNDIMATLDDDAMLGAKVKVLSEEIRHHVHEEELRGDGMFAQVRKTGVDLVALRDRMLERKRALMLQARDGGLPDAKMSVIRKAA